MTASRRRMVVVSGWPGSRCRWRVRRGLTRGRAGREHGLVRQLAQKDDRKDGQGDSGVHGRVNLPTGASDICLIGNRGSRSRSSKTPADLLCEHEDMQLISEPAHAIDLLADARSSRLGVPSDADRRIRVESRRPRGLYRGDRRRRRRRSAGHDLSVD